MRPWHAATDPSNSSTVSASGSVSRPVWLSGGRVAFAAASGERRLLSWLDVANPAQTHEVPGGIGM